MDDATRQRAVTAANVSVAQANIDAAKAQIGILNAKTAEIENGTIELKIALEKAQRDLSFTEIKAPFDGVVANRAVEPGQYVGPGSRLMALVPTTQSFIEANFKETQLADIHPGQKALITIDAFDGEKFEGTVQSIAPASGRSPSKWTNCEIPAEFARACNDACCSPPPATIRCTFTRGRSSTIASIRMSTPLR